MIIRADSLTKTLWKNGGGLTTEIFRVGGDDYEWRASFAEVRSSGPFSEFYGYDRALMIWDGAGLRLNGKTLRPFEPLCFRGEEKISADLIQGPVLDFGIIFRRDLYACELAVRKDAAMVDGLAFVVQGMFKIENENLSARDSFIGRTQLVPATDDAVAIVATLKRLP